MANSGIIRKIDELGRIVLPKELRKMLNINPGDDFEITIDDSIIKLKRYSRLENFEENINSIINCFSFVTKYSILFVVSDHLINNKDDKITNVINSIILERKIYINDKIEKNIISKNTIIEGKMVLVPLVSNSDLLGAVVVVAKDNIDNMKKIANIICSLIKKTILFEK